MKIVALAIPEVRLITPARHGDHRGFFSETYNRAALAAAGITTEFVQDNQSLSRQRGVVRGLHYQVAPAPQAKLVRVLRGAILDVAVDLRRSSATFGRHVSAVLSAENWDQLYVPEGFAHGFVTLEPDTEVAYKVSTHYAPAAERGIRFDDPAIGIAWPVETADVILSPKDAALPPLAEAVDLFE